MKTLTPEQIMDLNPCPDYYLERLEKLFGNKESVTYLEILDTDKIPLKDIIWLFCQPTVLDKDIRNQWIEIIVTRAVTNCALHCGVDTVELWATNWLSGVDRTVEAASVARNAIYAARYAAADAAYAAVYFADAFIAACAAGYAAGYATYAIDAYIAARDVEYKQQIKDLKEILQGESK
jgi:hypothetical protein